MTNMYADYVLERHGWHTIEKEVGFVQYSFMHGDDEDGVVIEEIYVKPEHRGGGHEAWNRGDHPFWQLVTAVIEEGKKRKCTILLGKIVPSKPFASKNMYCQLVAGMQIFKAHEDEIWMCKEI